MNKEIQISNRFAPLVQYEFENILSDSILFEHNDFQRIQEIESLVSSFKRIDQLFIRT